jgi:hypothetical protein
LHFRAPSFEREWAESVALTARGLQIQRKAADIQCIPARDVVARR